LNAAVLEKFYSGNVKYLGIDAIFIRIRSCFVEKSLNIKIRDYVNYAHNKPVS
jgi:hypothetical protein